MHLEACSNRGPVSILSEPSNFKTDLIRLIKEGYSPETAILLLKQTYDVTICYKTVYNAIDRGDLEGLRPVSYTHLDVYKRQIMMYLAVGVTAAIIVCLILYKCISAFVDY